MKQKQLFLFQHRGTTFVLTESQARPTGFSEPNFMGQHLALAGIAKPFETLEEVTARFAETHLRNMSVFFGEGHTSSNPVYARKKKPFLSKND